MNSKEKAGNELCCCFQVEWIRIEIFMNFKARIIHFATMANGFCGTSTKVWGKNEFNSRRLFHFKMNSRKAFFLIAIFFFISVESARPRQMFDDDDDDLDDELDDLDDIDDTQLDKVLADLEAQLHKFPGEANKKIKAKLPNGITPNCKKWLLC